MHWICNRAHIVWFLTDNIIHLSSQKGPDLFSTVNNLWFWFCNPRHPMPWGRDTRSLSGADLKGPYIIWNVSYHGCSELKVFWMKDLCITIHAFPDYLDLVTDFRGIFTQIIWKLNGSAVSWTDVATWDHMTSKMLWAGAHWRNS